ncbi:MAG: ThiF family adenylyltransferase [Candidatus Omnitrophica bacterium]|nr:ThiF family adenylyltransferase [Candidatus Omnitrophota bacterium]
MEPGLERYSRQILFSGVGEAGQKKLLASRIVVIGCGALGTVQANALVRSGIGDVVIVDRDYVEENNLQRQILFDEEDVRQKLPKAVAAERKLKLINSKVRVTSIVADVNHKNIESLVGPADLVMDGVDNFETRLLLNDVCVKNNKPWIYGACIGSYGITMPVIPGKTPCVRCVFETAPPPGLTPTCDTAGILSSTVNLVASLQVAEAMKILMGQEDKLHRDLVAFDLWANMFKTLHVSKGPKPDCLCCGQRNFEYLDAKDEQATFATSLCGRNAVQVNRGESMRVEFDSLAQRLEGVAEVSHNDFILTFKVDGFEVSVFTDGRAIIKGSNDPAVARSVYSKYIGS